MAGKITLTIIKPDAVANEYIGSILSKISEAGFHIAGLKLLSLTVNQAKAFYAVHKERPFYKDLVDFMISGPVVVQVLEGEDAIARNRELMGATNPADAAAGTIRADFAQTVDENAVHGSDGPDTARQEIEFFFGQEGVCERTR